MPRRFKPPREEAARALCHMDGHPPDISFEGAPMWVSYLPQVDTVLMLVLGDEAWQKLLKDEGVEREPFATTARLRDDPRRQQTIKRYLPQSAPR